MKYLNLLTLTLPVIFLVSIPDMVFAAPSADEIVKKADQGRLPQGAISFHATVKDYKKTELAHETQYEILNNATGSGLVKTIFPERQQGRKLLMEGSSLWLYTPDIKRAARVSMQQKLTGEIANGDLAKTNFAGDYNATILGSETVNGVETYHLSLKAKHSEVTYSKLEYWVAKKDFLPVKTVFYAVSGKVLKTGAYSEPKMVLGNKCITKFVVTDAVDTTRKSIVFYSNHKRGHFPDTIFSKEALSE